MRYSSQVQDRGYDGEDHGSTTNSAAYAISPSRFRNDAIGKLPPVADAATIRTSDASLLVNGDVGGSSPLSTHTIMSISAIRILPAGYGAPLSCHLGDRSRRLLTNRPKLTYMSQQSVAEVFPAVGIMRNAMVTSGGLRSPERSSTPIIRKNWS